MHLTRRALGLALAALSIVSYAAPGEVTLSEILETALKQNPQKEAVKAESRAASFSSSAMEPLLPAPTFTVGSMGEQGPFAREGHMETSFMVSQTLPFPTKTLARRKALNAQSLASQAQAAAFDLSLQNQVRKSYFAYLEATQRRSLLDELAGIYHHHLKRLDSASLQDQLMQSHIINAKNELALIDNELAQNEEQLTISRGELNVLMGRPADAELGQPREPELSKLPPAPTKDSESQSLSSHPSVLAMKAQSQAFHAEQQAARSNWLPDLMLSYRYNRRYDGTPNNSEVMVGLSLPFVYFNQPRAQSAQAEARFVKAQAELKQFENEVGLRIWRSYASLKSLHRQLENLTQNVIPLAKKRVGIIMSLSPTDMESLSEHREALEQYAKLRIEALEKRSQYENALADYETLSGPGPMSP